MAQTQFYLLKILNIIILITFDNKYSQLHQRQMKQFASYSSNVMIVDAGVNNKRQKYKKINAYTHKASIQQIGTIIIFFINLIMHCVFLIRPILGINHPILYIMWAIFIILLIGIIIEYFYLTCMDPVDHLLQNPEDIAQWTIKQNEHGKKYPLNKKKSNSSMVLTSQNPFQLKQCKACSTMVQFSSYHCWTCQRCVENMDHHCKFLNNCIGGKNYFIFFCLILFVIIYLFLGKGIAIWIFVRTFNDSEIQNLSINKWAILVYIIFSLLCNLVVQSLCYFHCYISCYLRLTTVQYIFRDSGSNYSSQRQLESAEPRAGD